MSKQSVDALSWGQRFALIDAYQPNDEQICQAFHLAPEELNSARDLRTQGTFKVDTTLNVEAYKSVFQGETKAASVTQHTAPRSATKKAVTATNSTKRTGKKGNKILSAFTAVPSTPVSIEKFATEHNVSVAVLRQSKRFDNTGVSGEVKVKKNKESGQLMIWREGTKVV